MLGDRERGMCDAFRWLKFSQDYSSSSSRGVASSPKKEGRKEEGPPLKAHWSSNLPRYRGIVAEITKGRGEESGIVAR